MLLKVATAVFHSIVPCAEIMSVKFFTFTLMSTVEPFGPETVSAQISNPPPLAHDAGAVKRLFTVKLQPGKAEKLAVAFTDKPFEVKPVNTTVCGLEVIAKL